MAVCQWIPGSSDTGPLDVFDESLTAYMTARTASDVQVLQLGSKIGATLLYEQAVCSTSTIKLESDGKGDQAANVITLFANDV